MIDTNLTRALEEMSMNRNRHREEAGV
jgi:hypothetical protein